MLVVSLISLKGGVGKTSVTLGLAGAAQQAGLAALVVDLDPQANASAVLDAPEPRWTTNDVLADGRDGVLADAVTPGGWGPGVDLVAAEPALEHRNVGDATAETTLRRTMAGLRGYDLVLVDCPPSLGQLTKNGLAASDAVLVVTEPGFFAVQGAQKALNSADVVRSTYNPGLRTGGVVVNRVRSTAEHRYRVGELLTAYPSLVWVPTLPDRSAVQQAEGASVSVQRWHSPGARQVSAILAGYVRRLLQPAATGGTTTTAAAANPSRRTS